MKKGLAGDHLPAHRVVNSRGILSGASYFDTFDMQKMLLESEGVQVIWTQEGWRVNLKDFGWNNTIGDAVYLKSLFEQAEKGENSEGTEPGHKEQTV